MDIFAYFIALGNWSALAMMGTASAMMGLFFRIILVTAFVALLAYFVTKLIASRGRAGGWVKSGNLKIIESMAVGAQSMVHLIKAGEKYLVIGVSKERGVTLLTELSKEEVDEPTLPEQGMENLPFNKIFQKFLPQAKDGQGEEDSE
ncbi:MAG: flagellar biosynthetic protein FliO [Defluviitaleaceae bacterium]|nr:flagellar biosynthetic protein FliO [Defluviitaleaceae bacterium]